MAIGGASLNHPRNSRRDIPSACGRDKASGVAALLTSLRPDVNGVLSELGTRRDFAYLRLSASTEPDRWAVVSTPGDRWFALEVDGGFSVLHFEEDTADVDVETLLA